MSRRMSFAEALFRAALRLYPAAQRHDYGEEMLRVFREQEAASEKRGWFFLAAAADAVTGALRAHAWTRRARASGQRNSPRPPGRITTLRHDLVVAHRRFLSRPGFSLLVVLVLAVGIGANTAIFSVVYGVLIRPLGLHDPASLAIVKLHRADDPADRMGFFPLHLEHLRKRMLEPSGVEGLASFHYDSVTLEALEGAEEIGTALMVDGSFFELLGVEPILGRTLGKEDVVPDRRGEVCVLGETYWRTRLGADPGILGRRLNLDGQVTTVVGVMPEGVPMPDVGVGIWIPQGWDVEDPSLYGRLRVLARLDDASSLPLVEQRLADGVEALATDFARLDGYTVTLTSFHEALVGSARTTIRLVAGGAGLILLLACANVASLLLARATARRQEMATRRALGAGTRQVASQLMCESLLLALAGGGAGVALAFGLHALLLRLAAGLIPRLYDVRLDLTALGFATLLSVATGILFGLVPVLHSRTRDLARAMRGNGPIARPALMRARSLLVTGQVALAVTLSLGAALMLRTTVTLEGIDPGFESAGVVGARIYLDSDAYGSDPEQARYFEQLVDALRARPGIISAGAGSALPMDPQTIDYHLPYTIPGDAPASRQAYFRTITPGYLETMKIRVLRGRSFDARDRLESESVALVNETFAQLTWPGEEPLGKGFAIYGGNRKLQIVGVVSNVRFAGPADAERAEFFVAHSQFSYTGMTVVARFAQAEADPAAITRAALALDPRQPVHSTVSLEALEHGSIARQRFLMTFLSTLSSLALLLAAAGLFGLLSGWVAERRWELGLRIALGAGSGNIVALVLRRSLVTVAVGLLLGLVGARLLDRLVLPFLFGVSSGDLTSLGAVVGAVFAVASLASLAPALRAARIPPMRVLGAK